LSWQDILDTGNTLQYMLKSLQSRDPASVRTVCFLHKVPAPHPTARPAIADTALPPHPTDPRPLSRPRPQHEMTKPGVVCDFVGFKVPNHFLVGYGLDYAQKYRGLSFIGVLATWVYSKLDPRLDGCVGKGFPADAAGLPIH
jgi:hypoxanthine phosphoribosyltransferase